MKKRNKQNEKSALSKPADPSPPAVKSKDVDPLLTLVASVFRHQMEKVSGEEDNPVVQNALRFAAGMLKRFAPRDPVEEMLFAQMVMTYGRMVYLTSYADQQANLQWAAMMHEAADRAANTFRRQMQALADYRRPAKPLAPTMNIEQANIAAQQVVTNAFPDKEKAANELGSAGTASSTPALSSHASGLAIPPGSSQPQPAMAVQHRPENAGG